MLQEYLQTMTEMRKMLPPPEDFKYNCIEAFVLAHGRQFNKIPKPKWVKKGIIKQCFSNCFEEALRHPDKLVYCEGYATGVIPVHHAWLLYNDKIIDPTWDHMKEFNDRKPEYFGISFKLEYVAKTIEETGYYSVLDNWTQRFPLLTGVHKIEDVKYA